MSEAASDDELVEHILYYRNASIHVNGCFDSASPIIESPNQIQEAIEFSSLCTALFSLSAVLDKDSVDDHAREVFFDNSTLVFQVVEEPQILVVAQITRSAGTPAAVGAALRRCHSLFSLLRGGGVDYRLRQSPPQSSDQRQPLLSTTCTYPHMDTLYGWRKQKRQLNERIRRNDDDTGDMNDYEQSLRQIESDIDQLLNRLHISLLRQDIRLHYDAFLSDYAELVRYGPGRCIVEELPDYVPGTQDRPAVRNNTQLVLCLQQFLAHGSALNKACIAAVSVFANGRLISTERRHCCAGYDISNETSMLLLGYLSSYRCHMMKKDTTLSATDMQSPKVLSPLSLSIGQTMLDMANIDRKPSEPDLVIGFLPPPPLSMLSVSEHLESDFEGPKGQRVWAPVVTLPCKAGTALGTRMCLYDTEQASFLIFLQRPVEDETESSYAPSLTQFVDQISLMKKANILQASEKSKDVHLSRSWHEEGQDVVFIDRLAHSVSIFLSSSSQDTMQCDHELGNTRSFFSFNKTARQQNNQDLSTPQSRESTDLDARYSLGSRLSLDTLLAVDDVIAEMSLCECGQMKESLSSLAQHWIYAYSDGHNELLMLFDSRKYATVADIQTSAFRAREHLVNNKNNLTSF